MFNVEIIHLKVKDVIPIIVKFRLKKICVYLSLHQSSFQEGHHKILSMSMKYCVATKEQIGMFWKYLRFISITWFGYWFVEKILSMLSSSWWCTHVPRASANEAYKINWWQEFPILLALNYYTFMCTGNFYKYEHIYTYRKK